jgi:putative ABC transport system permease protein
MMSPVERLVARLLRCHPDPFTPLQAADVVELLRARAAAARARGRLAWARFLVRELGSLILAALAEQARHAARLPRVFARELRHAARRLSAAPGFTASAVATIALTLGALVAGFTLVYRIVLAPLPYPAADRLIDLDHAAAGVGIERDLGMSIGLYHQYATLPSIEAIAIYYVGERTFSEGGETVTSWFLHTTPSLAAVIDGRPALGRWFTGAEGAAGGAKVIVLTDGFWRRRFGARVDVVGTTVRVDGVPHEIVGVMPRGFAFPDPRVEYIAPLPVPAQVNRAAGFNYAGIARLKPGVTVERVRADQDALITDLPNRFPSDPESGLLRTSQLRSITAPMKSRIVGEIAGTLWILLGACATVVAIACANLANLFLVRAESQRAEVVLRRALGADGVALGAYHLAESLLITSVAAAVALLLADGAIAYLQTSEWITLPRLHEVKLGTVAIVFVAAASTLIWLLLSAMPAVQSRILSGGSLHDRQRRTTAGRTALRLRHTLIGAQVALALVLLTSAGLLARSVTHLVRTDPGFRMEDRLVFRIGLPGSAFRDRAAAAAWHEAVLERLKTISGVQAVAAGSTLPLTGDSQRDPIEVFGRTTQGASLPVVRFTRVSPSFFSALGIRLRAGRFFDHAEARGKADGVIVNETLVRLYFPGGRPLGQRIRPHGTQGDRWLTIVGVVGDTATFSVQEPDPGAKLYVPLSGSLWADVPSPHEMAYVLHTSGQPLAAAPEVRELVRGSDPELAIAGMERYEDVASRSRAGISLAMILITLAAVIALALGILGVYAVVAYSVAQRRTEIAVRLAVGATPQQVLRLQLRQGAAPILIGLAAGLVGALFASRALRTLLFGVSPHDPLTYVAAAALLLVVGVLSCWWPARRAAQASPVEALRG